MNRREAIAGLLGASAAQCGTATAATSPTGPAEPQFRIIDSLEHRASNVTLVCHTGRQFRSLGWIPVLVQTVRHPNGQLLELTAPNLEPDTHYPVVSRYPVVTPDTRRHNESLAHQYGTFRNGTFAPTPVEWCSTLRHRVNGPGEDRVFAGQDPMYFRHLAVIIQRLGPAGPTPTWIPRDSDGSYPDQFRIGPARWSLSAGCDRLCLHCRDYVRDPDTNAYTNAYMVYQEGWRDTSVHLDRESGTTYVIRTFSLQNDHPRQWLVHYPAAADIAR